MTASAGPPLHTSDGLVLAGCTWLHPSPRAAVVLVHGFAASASDAAVVRQAEALVERGFDVVSYDARGHGESEGLCTLGDLEQYDVAAAVAAARERVHDVVLLGASMGAIAVLRHAATGIDALAGVVVVSSPAAWRIPRTARSLMAAGLTRTPVGRRVATRYLKVRIAPRWTNPEPPRSLAARITRPLALVHGQRDRFIPPREAVELYAACIGPRRLDLVPGMGHAFDPLGVPVVCDAVDWVLSQA